MSEAKAAPPQTLRRGRAWAVFAAMLALLAQPATEANAQEDGAQQGEVWETCAGLGAAQPQTIGQIGVTPDDYPLVSMGLNEEGRALLDVDVAADGAIRDVRISESSGSFRLDDSSIEIVRERWRFDPPLAGGMPVACTTQVAVRWEVPNLTYRGAGNQPTIQLSDELLRLLGLPEGQ
jgi:TonB family protein